MWTILALRQRLQDLLGHPVEVKINDNLTQMISVRYPSASVPPRISLHRAFLAADDSVVRALAGYIRRPTPQVRRVLRAFINTIPLEASRVSCRKICLRARGRCYDLDRIAKELMVEFFGETLDVAITWGRNALPGRRRRRHIQLGAYYHHQRLIRIHPVLDAPDIPEFFVRFVVYHELLHAKLDPQHDDNGRRRLHTPEFRQLERLFPHYREAIAFERELLERL